MAAKVNLNPEEELIERRRAFIRQVMEDRTAKDIEYGYYWGTMEGAQCIKERKDQVDKPLSCDVRACPAIGPVRYSITIPGCVPLLHGPEGCAYWHKGLWCGFGSFALMPMWPVITTAMDQEDVFFGGEEALRRAILEADKLYQPDLITVINTCAGAIIGDDIEGVCESLKGEVKSLLAPVSLPGFCSRNQVMGYDQFLMSLSKHVMEESGEKVPNTINYIGETFGGLRPEVNFVTDAKEIDRVLLKLGVKINSCLPGDRVEKIKKAPQAQLNVCRCMGAGLNYAKYAKERYGQDYTATCVPLGLQPTTDFYLGIIEALSLGKGAERVLQEEIKETLEALKPYKEVLKGKRFGLAASAGRTTSLAQLYLELGMEPIFILIHFVREKTLCNMEVLSKMLKEKGYNPEVIIEPGLYEEEALLDFYRPDIYFNDYHEKSVALHFGIPAFEVMTMCTMGPWQGYRGAVLMAEMAVAALKNPLFSKKGPKLFPSVYSSKRFLETQRAKRLKERSKEDSL